MGTGTSVASRRSNRSGAQSRGPSAGTATSQLLREPPRLATAPGSVATAVGAPPRSQQSSRATSARPSLLTRGSSSSEDEVITPPLVRSTRGYTVKPRTTPRRELVLKCVEKLERGLGINLVREQLLRGVQEIRHGPGEVILRRGEPGVGVFVVQDGGLEVMSPEEDVVLCRLQEEEFCGELSSFFHIPCTATVRTQPGLSTTLLLLPVAAIAESTQEGEVAELTKLQWCSKRSYVDTADMFESGHLSQIEITNCLKSPSSVFSTWSTEALIHIATISTPMLFSSGDELCEAGEKPFLLFLILRGILQFSDTMETSDASHMTIKSSSKGYCIGIKEFFSGGRMAQTITAASPVLAVPLSEDTLTETVNKFPSNTAQWRDLQQRYRTI